MKVYGSVHHYGELKTGDVLIEHKRSGRPEDLITHAAVVAEDPKGELPWIFHLTGWGGLALDQIYKTNSTCWAGYRLKVEGVGVTVSDIAMYWIHNNVGLENLDFIAEGGVTVPHVYDAPSVLTPLLSRSYFGHKARQYTGYLHANCRTSPPDALRPGSGNFFSGAICSFLQIALYQTALGAGQLHQY